MTQPNHKLRYYPLASRVLAVAVVNEEVGDWTAYVDAVPGINHVKEYQKVAISGSKLPKEVAKVLFPEISTSYKWRE